LRISDNGKGYDPPADEQGMGNINIKSRVELYFGSVAIVSKPGEGYELKVILPLKGRKNKQVP
jgi:signal transduction histidine kinase